MQNKQMISAGLVAAALVWVAFLSLLSGGSGTAESLPASDGSRAEITFIDKSRFYHEDSGEIALRMNIQAADGNPMLGLAKQKVRVNEESVEVLLKEFHGPGTQSINVILVIDVSGSMSGFKLREAQEAAEAALNELQIGRDRIGIIAFNDGMRVIHPLSDLTSDSKSDCRNQLRALAARGQTRIGPPTLRALELFGDSDITGPKLLMVMTDGEDDDLEAMIDQIATDSDRQGVPVYTIAFGEKIAEAETVLRTLASRCAGEYFFAPTGDELARIYRDQVKEVGNSFIAVYDSPWPDADGLPRKVEVTVDSTSGELISSSGYQIGPMITGGQRAAPRLADGTSSTGGGAGALFLKSFLLLVLLVSLGGGLAASEYSPQLRARLGASTTTAAGTSPATGPPAGGAAVPVAASSAPRPAAPPPPASVLKARTPGTAAGSANSIPSPAPKTSLPPPPPKPSAPKLPGSPASPPKAPAVSVAPPPPKPTVPPGTATHADTPSVKPPGVQRISPISAPPPPPGRTNQK